MLTSPNTILFVFRHAHTRDDVLEDEKEPLSAEGIIHANLLGQHLKRTGVTPVAIYSSKLTRAQQTRDALLKNFPGVSIYEDNRLRDTVGTYVGKPKSWLDQYGDVHDIHTPSYAAQIPDDKMVQMETKASIARRMVGVTHDIFIKHRGETVFIVSHQEPTAHLRWLLNNPDKPVPRWPDLKTYGVLEPAEGWKWTCNGSLYKPKEERIWNTEFSVGIERSR